VFETIAWDGKRTEGDVRWGRRASAC
jgi:hypothetical protein